MDSNILKGVIGIVGIAISLIVFPIVMTGAVAILGNSHISSYTGLEEIVKIAPLVIFVGLLFTSGAAIVSGVKGYRKKAKTAGFSGYRRSI